MLWFAKNSGLAKFRAIQATNWLNALGNQKYLWRSTESYNFCDELVKADGLAAHSRDELGTPRTLTSSPQAQAAFAPADGIATSIPFDALVGALRE